MPTRDELITQIFQSYGITDYPMNRKMLHELLDRAAPQVEAGGWFLPAEKLNEPQAEKMPQLLKRCRGAHYIDVHVRINGQSEYWQADWLRDLEPIAAAPEPHAKEK